jgi:hypothetical protein
VVKKRRSLALTPGWVVKKKALFGFDPCGPNFGARKLKVFKSIFQLPTTSRKKGRKYQENIICATPGFSIFFAIVVYWSNP